MKVRQLKHRRKARPWCVQAKVRHTTNFIQKEIRATAREAKNARFRPRRFTLLHTHMSADRMLTFTMRYHGTVNMSAWNMDSAE